MTLDHSSLFIGGKWTSSAGTQRISVWSATDEHLLGSVPEGVSADIDAAVWAARNAFDTPHGWSRWPTDARAEVLERFADEYENRRDEILPLISKQNGMPVNTARVLEAVYPPLLLRYYAKMIRHLPVDEDRPGILVHSSTIQHRPIGVVAAIVPWNVPQTLAMTKLAPALAAGCSVVMKPSPEAVLDSYLLADAASAAGLPAGVLSIVHGGRDLGAYLVGHSGVDKVAFTGSTAGGRSVAEACARMLRPVTLELGGKGATIVLDDADLSADGARESLFGLTLGNNGQVCFAGSRILAPRSRYDEVVDFFATLVGEATVGDPLDETTMIGPLASAAQRQRVTKFIDAGVRSDARLVVGGAGAPAGRERGWFVRPTLFADVDNAAMIAQEEIFGPVLTVIPYDGDGEAVRIANDSQYGLGSSVWSADHDRAMRVASDLDTGVVGINGFIPEPTAPFGGVKSSGLGKEFGPEAFANYRRTKSIYHFSAHPDATA